MPNLASTAPQDALASPDLRASVPLTRIVDALTGKRLAVLTGAGLSTDSGIPDYRGPGSTPRNPMTYGQFIGDPGFRRHYWARNHIGWGHMAATAPNAGHHALVRLEQAGIVTGIITQNVDTLHQRAGSQNLIDLHGSFDRVICLDCRNVVSRESLDERLTALNPGFRAEQGEVEDIEIAPDADAVIESTAHFKPADCELCGGILKPDIVYFGESVPRARVAASFAMVDDSDVLLVAGSSLTVHSGLRFTRYAVKQGKPVMIVNRGATRADHIASLTWHTGTSEALTALADALPAT